VLRLRDLPPTEALTVLTGWAEAKGVGPPGVGTPIPHYAGNLLTRFTLTELHYLLRDLEDDSTDRHGSEPEPEPEPEDQRAAEFAAGGDCGPDQERDDAVLRSATEQAGPKRFLLDAFRGFFQR
jgi:hypothetical protein